MSTVGDGMAERCYRPGCRNYVTGSSDYCSPTCEAARFDETPHVGHFSRFGETWWCDTCNSPYCELL